MSVFTIESQMLLTIVGCVVGLTDGVADGAGVGMLDGCSVGGGTSHVLPL